MKYALIPIVTLLFLNQISDRLLDIKTGYVILICGLALIPSLISLYYKKKDDRENGKVNTASTRIFIVAMVASVLISFIMY